MKAFKKELGLVQIKLNCSLKEKVVPPALKEAVVQSFFKKSLFGQATLGNSQPIKCVSDIPFLGRVFERVVKLHLQRALEEIHINHYCRWGQDRGHVSPGPAWSLGDLYYSIHLNRQQKGGGAVLQGSFLSEWFRSVVEGKKLLVEPNPRWPHLWDGYIGSCVDHLPFVLRQLLYIGLPLKFTQKFQLVQNAVAWVDTNVLWIDCIALWELHVLPISF